MYQIQFSGLIAMVPNKGETTAQGRVRLLFPDARDRNRDSTGEELYPETPFIQFHLDDLRENSPRVPDVVSGGYGVCFLNREELTIGPKANANKQELRYMLNDATGEEPRNENYLPDLRWVLPLEEIGVDNVELDARRYLVGPYKVRRDGKDLVARIRLGKGTLETRDLLRCRPAGEDLVTVCGFEDAIDQTLATVVVYQPPGNTGLRIQSERFRRKDGRRVGGPIPPLAFKPANGRKVRINIWNASFGTALNTLGGSEHHNWPHGDQVRSFRSFFRLSKNPHTEIPDLRQEGAKAARFQPRLMSLDKDLGCPLGGFSADSRA